MRLYRLLLALLALALVLGSAPAQAQTVKNNVVTVEPLEEGDEPLTLLDEEEVAKIDRLQNDIVYSLPLSPVSPDDQAIFMASGEEFGFLNIVDGSTVVVPPEAFQSFLPLPLLGISQFTWLDDVTLGTLALDFAAETEAESVVILGINRETLELSATPIALPADTGLVSVSPDLLHFLLVVIPPEEDPNADASDEIKVQTGLPIAAGRPSEQLRLPAFMQRRVEQARKTMGRTLDRFQLMQDDPNDGATEVTLNTLDLVSYDARSGELRYVTTVPEATGLLGEAWTGDSSRLAISFFSLTDPDDLRPFYDGALLSEIFYRDATGNLPPADNPLLQNNNTYIIDSASGDVQILRPSGGNAPPLLVAEDWSTDNATLMTQAWYPARIKGRTYPIYQPQFSEQATFRFYNRDLRMTKELANNALSAGTFSSTVGEFVSPDEVIFRGVVGSNRHPYYYNLVSGELRNIADRAGTYGAIRSTNRSRQLVVVYQSFVSPPDIYRVGWDGKGFNRLTWFNEELRQFANLRQDPVSFTLRNGQLRVGTLIQPADATFPPKNKPLIVWQEGGPGVPMLNSWGTNVENPYSLLPTFGFSMLVVPLAGRPGYSPAVFNSLVDNSNFGQIDIDEQAEIVQQMITKGWTAKGKVGIVGCSYGGYFVAESIVRYPDLYAVANQQCALIDLVTEWTRGFDALMPYIEGLPPYNNPTEYRNDSPSYNAAKVKAAVLAFHGTEDFLPIVQNENFHLQLYNRGLPARFVKFVGEGHGLADPANQLYAAQEQLQWFRTYLQ